MQFGLHFEMEMPRPWNERSEYNIYWQALEQIELGDRLGFDFVWEVEHHFLEEYSHSSAPEVFFGAVSQRTKNIRIAHGVRLLPFQFNHPIKVAEQAAVLDIMSNGRVEFGLGRSTTVQELDGFSVDYERTREEVREATEIIVKAWTEEILEYDGKLMKIPPRRVVPKPIQKPHPPMWMACVAPDSYEIAGDRGLGVLSFTFNFEQVQKAIAKFRQACARRSDQIPKVVNEAFAGMVICHVVEKKTDEAIGLDGARWFMHYAAELFKPFTTKRPALLLRIHAPGGGFGHGSQGRVRRAAQGASADRGGHARRGHCEVRAAPERRSGSGNLFKAGRTNPAREYHALHGTDGTSCAAAFQW